MANFKFTTLIYHNDKGCPLLLVIVVNFTFLGEADEEKLKKEINAGLEYYNSLSRKEYSELRIDNGVGNLEAAMAKGIEIVNGEAH